MVLPTRSGSSSRWRRIIQSLTAITLAAACALTAGEFCVWQTRVALDNREHAAARRWLSAASLLSPRRGQVAFLSARLARRSGDFDSARSQLLVAADAGWPVPELEREQWIALAQTGQQQAMQAHWDELLMEPGSDLPEICEAFVREALKRLQVRDARRVLDAWNKDRPEDPKPYAIMAEIHASLREWEPAVEDFRAALERDPTDLDTQRGLAEALEKLLRFDEALIAWTGVLEALPGDGQAAVGQSNCLARTGQAETARQQLSAWLNEHPHDLAALEAAGRLELVEGHAERAIERLSVAVTIRPEDAELRYALGRALRLAGREDEAAEHLAYRQAAEEPLTRLRDLLNELPARPQDPDIRGEIATLTYRWKSREEGLQWAAATLDLDPQHAAARELQSNTAVSP
jgi:tetratricopeptide (TPR) repeat protein